MQALTLMITGRVYVKKNSRQMRIRGRQMFTVPSANFEKFKNAAISQISKQLGGAVPASPLFSKMPISITTLFMVPGKTRVDADNMHTSILDILQDANVIEDDNEVVSGGYMKISGCKDWLCKIDIELVDPDKLGGIL